MHLRIMLYEEDLALDNQQELICHKTEPTILYSKYIFISNPFPFLRWMRVYF